MSSPHPMSIPHSLTLDGSLLLPISGVALPVGDTSYHVYIVADSRGESADYEAYSLIAFSHDGRRAWVEGIRKDRTEMRSQYREPIDAFFAG